MRRVFNSFVAPRAAAVLVTLSRYQSQNFGNANSFANNNNNNNQAFNSVSSESVAARNQGAILPGQPRFDIFDIRDNPAEGYRLRVNYNDRKVFFQHVAQLGPRKTDPNDPAPQFDESKRHGIRLFIHEIAGFLTVTDGLAAQYKMVAKGHELTFEPLLGSNAMPTGYRLSGYTLNNKTSAKNEWDVKFEGQNAVMLRHFLNSSLNTAFGFGQTQRQGQQQQRRNNNNNNGNYTNTNNANNNYSNNNNNNNGGQQQRGGGGQNRRNNNQNRQQQNNNNNNNYQSFNPPPQQQQKQQFTDNFSSPYASSNFF